jgi:hypothetical protein
MDVAYVAYVALNSRDFIFEVGFSMYPTNQPSSLHRTEANLGGGSVLLDLYLEAGAVCAVAVFSIN